MDTSPKATAAGRRVRPPWRVLAGLVAAAALLHALLLAGVMTGTPAVASGGGGSPALAMQVRTLPPPPASPAAEAHPGELPVSAAPPWVATAPVRTTGRPARSAAVSALTAASTAAADATEATDRADATASPAAPAGASSDAADAPSAATAADTAPMVDVAVADAQSASGPAPPAAAGAAIEAGAAGAGSSHGSGGADHGTARDDEMPIYKTAFPPPLTLHYDLRRGLLSGSGTLIWRPAGDHYEMRLEGRVAGLNVLTQISQGGFDDAGIAPRRYTDQRMNREARAANFQREQGRITFSGPQAEYPLLVGTQDRLSWMIQLAAVVSAEPRRLAPGGKVAIYVVGARGDAAMWVFRSIGTETIDTPGGRVRAAKFTREPRGAHDTLAEAWLDAARHGLPVRARIGGESGEALELNLRDLQLP